MALPARPRLLLTGFGAFANITDNPSARVLPALAAALAERLGESISISARALEVRFGAIDVCHPENYDVVVSLGVDAKTSAIRVETHARNHFVDLAGNARSIDDAQLEPIIAGKPLPPLPSRAGDWEVAPGTAGSAGTFVCNQTYYTLCCSVGIDGYFIHIPNIPATSDEGLVRALCDLISELLAASARGAELRGRESPRVVAPAR
jgi:pyrrolidone-carboxylate peptidase